MSDALRYGCGMIAFSPALCFLFLLLSKRPQLVIVSLASGFAFLVSILCTAIFWNIQHAIARGNDVWILVIIVSIAFQEVFRYLFVLAYRKTERIIKMSSPNSAEIFPLNDVSSSMAAGVGFGAMHSLMMYGSVLAASNGTGDLFLESCSGVPVIFQSAFISLGFSILDCILMCMAFIAEKTQSRMVIVVICLMHLLASFSTVANTEQNGCKVAIPLVYATVGLSAGFLLWMWPLMMRGLLQTPSR